MFGFPILFERAENLHKTLFLFKSFSFSFSRSENFLEFFFQFFKSEMKWYMRSFRSFSFFTLQQ